MNTAPTTSKSAARCCQGGYRVKTDALDTYLVPKKSQTITIESLHDSGRGVSYTRSPFAYLFTRLQ